MPNQAKDDVVKKPIKIPPPTPPEWKKPKGWIEEGGNLYSYGGSTKWASIPISEHSYPEVVKPPKTPENPFQLSQIQQIQADRQRYLREMEHERTWGTMDAGKNQTSYSEWLNTPSSKASTAIQKLQPIQGGSNTWWGRGGFTQADTAVYAPLYVLDKIAREVAKGSPQSNAQKLLRAINNYPTYKTSSGKDTGKKWNLRTLLHNDKNSIRDKINYFRSIFEPEKLGNAKPRPYHPSPWFNSGNENL